MTPICQPCPNCHAALPPIRKGATGTVCPECQTWVIKLSTRGKYFFSYRVPGLWWFRICGRGLHAKKVSLHPLTPSDRYGKNWHVTVNGWRFKLLRKERD